MIESGSSLGTYLDCPRRYYFAYVKLLSSRHYQKNLAYGSMLHALVEEYHLNRMNKPAAVFAPLIEELRSKYGQSQEDIEADAILARGVFLEWKKHYEATHGDLGNAALVPSSVEREWTFPVGGDLHAGKSDAVLKHKSYPGDFLYELKTSGDTDRNTYKHRLELDKQISSNLIAMASDGYQPKGVIYDIIWKPRLVARKEETKQELNERILKKYAEAPSYYFERLMVFRSERDLADYGLDLTSQFAALRSSYERGHFHRNTNACERFGKLCPFFNMCMSGSPQEQEDFYQRRDRKLPELSQGVQDGSG